MFSVIQNFQFKSVSVNDAYYSKWFFKLIAEFFAKSLCD